MNREKVTIYVSDRSQTCDKVIEQLKNWEIPFNLKNITQHPSYRKELQEEGIYSTPATFISGVSKAILGFQKRNLQVALEVQKLKRKGETSFLLAGKS